MLLEIVFCLFKFYFHYLVLFQKGVNTSFMNCDQVLSLSQLIHTWGLVAVLNFQMRLKKQYLSSFLNCVNYKL